jgi:hypothetical protein
MISHCANPECKAEFTHMREGALFVIQVPNDVPEYYWLCPPCAIILHVVHDSSVGMRVEARPDPRPNPPWGLIPSVESW